MGNCCHDDSCSAPARPDDGRFARILWIALAVNAAMFLVEAGAGLAAGSLSLQADSLDFLADAANYAVSLMVVASALAVRAKAAILKGATMGLLGLWILGATLWHVLHGGVPNAFTMGWVGFLALLANLGVAMLLWAYRRGDSNMRSVWLCSRNDAIGNVVVLVAAAGVFGTGTAWPDLVVAASMACLSLQAALSVIRGALSELRAEEALAA
ncbi:cation transporter [Afifella sp. IM 167]|uniref:cation transporter n=1 Tax=Afifella sp. IM 167 TaxID=2033586 RepID=UPI001CCEBDB5|nr:cation transporter [Afifella sp. IM 167]MBZ8132476.1 cobalt transporter [Afifella sp. IM 167]